MCPLGQPEKAIGLEPQIEPWLAFLLQPYCLSHQKPQASSRQQHDSAKKENPKSLPTLHGLESRAKIFAPSSRRGSFSPQKLQIFRRPGLGRSGIPAWRLSTLGA